MQRFLARERFEFSNGAIGWSPGGPMDCLGPYAKVQNCPIRGTNLRVTAYATGYADTMFSVPARTRLSHDGKVYIIKGFFTAGRTCAPVDEPEEPSGIYFVPMSGKDEALAVRISIARQSEIWWKKVREAFNGGMQYGVDYPTLRACEPELADEYDAMRKQWHIYQSPLTDVVNP